MTYELITFNTTHSFRPYDTPTLQLRTQYETSRYSYLPNQEP